MKLTLVISSLGGGGAERVMTTLAKAWAHQGNEVTLITLASRRHDRYPLDPMVRRIALDVTGESPNSLRAFRNNLARIRALRHAIKACDPDVVVSFVTRTNLLSLLATLGLQVPVVVSERTFPGARWVHGIWHALYRLLYRRAAAVVVQTHRCATEMELTLHCRTSVIPNAVEFEPFDSSSRSQWSAQPPPCRHDGRRTLLAVGRLSPEKGFDLLINAFARIAGRHPEWDLKILGDGMLRDELQQAIAASGCADRIAMPGFDQHVRAAMRRADLFALSSRFEGFPNVLLEAMSEGKACVSFDCYTGPRELIAHGENGWLVPAEDATALAVALHALMDDDSLRTRLGLRAREVRTLYSLPKVVGQWNALLASLATRPRAMRAAEENA